MNLNGSKEKVNIPESKMAVYLSKVFGWMFGGLMLTGLTGYIVASTPALTALFLGNQFLFIGLALSTLGLVVAISFAVAKLSPTASKVLFLIYSVVNGLTFAIYFIAFELGDMGLAFMLTGGIFAFMAVLGYKTKKDLTKVGALSSIALIAVIVVMVVNMFIGNSLLDIGISIAIVLIFIGLIAYDTKKIKELYYQYQGDQNALDSVAIMGALQLYLDFINMFIHILRLIARLKE